MAIDGTNLDLPDTPENKRFFGRPGTGRGKAAWPVAAVIALIEIGTRLTVDAFVGYKLYTEALKRGAHLLGRLKSNMIFEPIETLADGSFLAKLYPGFYARRKNQGGILVRIIEYTITDPLLPGFGEKHRLITSLLDA